MDVTVPNNIAKKSKEKLDIQPNKEINMEAIHPARSQKPQSQAFMKLL